MSDPILEALSAKFHSIYQAEARRQGNLRHHDDYTQLSEATKDYDRVLARFVMKYACEYVIHAMLKDPLTEEA
jgi:hypothetical protein